MEGKIPLTTAVDPTQVAEWRIFWISVIIYYTWTNMTMCSTDALPNTLT